MEGWYYDTLPNVRLTMTGRLTRKEDDDFEDDKKRSHFDHVFNWRIDEDTDEFVIRFSRKPDAPSSGHINVDLKIEGGLSTQSDGSVLFDGGLGTGEGTDVSKFSLSFQISHESVPDSDSEWTTDSEEEIEEPQEKEIKFFHHPQHPLHLVPENHYNQVAIRSVGTATCDACTEPIADGNARWVYQCPNDSCDYLVHAACAQLPRSIRHPSHMKHNLKLFKLAPGAAKICDVCKEDIPCGLHYNCAKCDFDLHPQCPEPGTVRNKVDEEDDKEESQETKSDSGAPASSGASLQMRLLQQQMECQMQLNMAQHLAASIANVGSGMLNLM